MRPQIRMARDLMQRMVVPNSFSTCYNCAHLDDSGVCSQWRVEVEYRMTCYMWEPVDEHVVDIYDYDDIIRNSGGQFCDSDV